MHGTTETDVCAWCGRSLDSTGGVPAGGRRRCSCGAALTWPQPTDAQLEAAYAGHYRPRSGRFLGPGDLILRHTRGRLARRLDALAPPGAVLDVGAGDGSLLDALGHVGRTAVGLERHSDRDDVRDVAIAEAGGDWAAIVMWHSLEHLREPGAAIAASASALRPGGILVVALPNSASLQARLFGDRWFALDLPRHLVHLPAAALVERLRDLGLEIERVSHWRGGQVAFGWLHGLVGLLPGHPDLYDAIRRPQARAASRPRAAVATTWLAAGALAPAALLAAAAEAALRRGGTVYVEARRGV